MVRDKKAPKRVGEWRAQHPLGQESTSLSTEAEEPPPIPAMRRLLPPREREARILELKLTAKDWLRLFLDLGPTGAGARVVLSSTRWARLPLDGNEDRYRTLYPLAWRDTIWQEAQRHDIDPLLVLAILRTESLYKADAVSSAGALGLVQVMPATGARVTELRGEEEFQESWLLDPAFGIRTGATYLGHLLRRFDGQYPLAVGSYNGGPHNIGRWLKNKQDLDFVDFVEEIPFRETRGYIQKVVRDYAIYHRLYRGSEPPPLPSKLQADDPSVIDF